MIGRCATPILRSVAATHPSCRVPKATAWPVFFPVIRNLTANLQVGGAVSHPAPKCLDRIETDEAIIDEYPPRSKRTARTQSIPNLNVKLDRSFARFGIG